MILKRPRRIRRRSWICFGCGHREMLWLDRKSEDGLYRETSGDCSARRAFNRRGEEGEFGFLQLDEKKFEPKSEERFDLEDVRKDGECAGDAGPQVQTLIKAMAAILCQR
jgi:hypothetical protein